MIILPSLKTIIITPPKTGSTSLHKGLCAGGEAIWVNGFAPHGRCVDHHVVGYAPGYKLLITVRHPLDRLVSLYLHQCRYDASQGRASEAFWCFANRVGRAEHPDPMYAWNLCKYLEAFAERPNVQSPPVAAGEFPPQRSHAPYVLPQQFADGELQLVAALRLENLSDDLTSHGISLAELPHVNRSIRRPWPAYFGEGGGRDSLLAIVEPWARPDCERFGYDWPEDAHSGESVTASATGGLEPLTSPR